VPGKTSPPSRTKLQTSFTVDQSGHWTDILRNGTPQTQAVGQDQTVHRGPSTSRRPTARQRFVDQGPSPSRRNRRQRRAGLRRCTTPASSGCRPPGEHSFAPVMDRPMAAYYRVPVPLATSPGRQQRRQYGLAGRSCTDRVTDNHVSTVRLRSISPPNTNEVFRWACRRISASRPMAGVPG